MLVHDVLSRASERLEEHVLVNVGVEVEVLQKSIGRRSTRSRSPTRQQSGYGQKGQGGTREADHTHDYTSDLTSSETAASTNTARRGVEAASCNARARGREDVGISGQTPVVASLAGVVLAGTVAPVAREGASRGVVGRGFRLGGTDSAVVDARAVDHTVGLELAVAVRGVAHCRPADGGKGHLTAAIFETSVDTITLRVTVVAVAAVVVEGPVTAIGAIGHHSGQAHASLAFSDRALAAWASRILRVASSKLLEVNAGVALVELVE